MNKILVLSSLSALMALSATQLMGQSQMSAIRLSEGENHSGSARFQALGGAMGAVGVDFSSVSQNPAGIALFRSRGKVSFTEGVYWNKEQNTWYGTASSLNKSGFRPEELSYMTSWLAGSSRSMTFGFGVRNSGRFDRRLDASTAKDARQGNSLADYAANIMNKASYGSNAYGVAGAYHTGAPWLGVLAWRAGWVGNAGGSPTEKGRFHSAYSYDDAGNRDASGAVEAPQSVGLVLEESGYMTDYDLALGINFSPSFSLGVSGTISWLDYTLRSSYSEGFRRVAGLRQVDGLGLDSWSNTRGAGFKLGVGVLWEPTDGLRLGASVWTPTFYSLKMDYNAGAAGFSSVVEGDRSISESTPFGGANSFVQRNPWRVTFNTAYVFGKRGLVSVDYEYKSLGDTRLDEDHTDEDGYSYGNSYSGDNDAIKSDFGARHTLRIGGELNLTQQVALRAGFRRSFAPKYKEGFKEDFPKVEELVSGTQVHYSIPETYSTYSLGLGYRFTPRWTLDLAYVYGESKSRVYAFPGITDTSIAGQPSEWLFGLAPIREDRQQHRAVATISYRF